VQARKELLRKYICKKLKIKHQPKNLVFGKLFTLNRSKTQL